MPNRRLTLASLVVVALSLTAGNLCGQYLSDIPQYAIAIERSAFQCLALLVVWVVYRRSGA